MNRIFLILFALISLVSCKSPVLIEQSKMVKFKGYSDGSFFKPEFKAKLDSNFNGTFLIRYSKESESLIVSENAQKENQYVLELENSFVNHYFTVIDRPYFQTNFDSKKESNANYIVELIKIIPTKHYTGIMFGHNIEHYLTGTLITVKIVDSTNGKIVALLESEYTPCESGCKIKYNVHTIISVTDLSKKNARAVGETQFENNQVIELCDQIVYQVLAEIRNTVPNN